MSNIFVGEIRMFGGKFAPLGWHFCDGALLPISGNETLFNLIGTTYGGDGQNTFGLPNLGGRVPVHVGTGFVQGQSGGEETVTLLQSTTPVHTHPFLGTADAANQTAPAAHAPAQSLTVSAYQSANPNTPMSPQAVGLAGSQPHENMQPFLAVSFIIAMVGLYPSQ